MLYWHCKVILLYKIIMKVEENIYLAKLFDAYGALLSEGQQKIMTFYLNYDYTITEIAENLNVSRQAIMDSISKADKKLHGFENKLQLVKKIEILNEENQKLKQKLSLKE